MCRSIQPLFNYDPPTTDEEIAASSLQYVRKVSGYRKPSRLNEFAFETAVIQISDYQIERMAAIDCGFNAMLEDT